MKIMNIQMYSIPVYSDQCCSLSVFYLFIFCTDDIWATQITMLPGPSYDSSRDWRPEHGSSMMTADRIPDMVMSQIWDNEEPTKQPTGM